MITPATMVAIPAIRQSESVPPKKESRQNNYKDIAQANHRVSQAQIGAGKDQEPEYTAGTETQDARQKIPISNNTG